MDGPFTPQELRRVVRAINRISRVTDVDPLQIVGRLIYLFGLIRFIQVYREIRDQDGCPCDD